MLSFRRNPQTAKPCLTNGIPFLLVIPNVLCGITTSKEIVFRCVYMGLAFAGGCLATKRNGIPMVLQGFGQFAEIVETPKRCFTNGFPFLLVVSGAPADRKTLFYQRFSISIGRSRVVSRVATPKEMGFHWLYKGSASAGGCRATKRNGFPLVLQGSGHLGGMSRILAE